METKPRLTKTKGGKPLVLWMNDENYKDFLYLEQKDNTGRFLVPILHREDGPAWIEDNCEEWYFMNKMHCLTGPAKTVRNIDDNSVVLEFFVDNMWITPKIEKWAEDVEIDLTDMSDDDRVLLSIKLSSFM